MATRFGYTDKDGDLIEGTMAEIGDILRLCDKEPAFFEQAVVGLVVAMGYGGADANAARTQLTNDAGIVARQAELRTQIDAIVAELESAS